MKKTQFKRQNWAGLKIEALGEICQTCGWLHSHLDISHCKIIVLGYKENSSITSCIKCSDKKLFRKNKDIE